MVNNNDPDINKTLQGLGVWLESVYSSDRSRITRTAMCDHRTGLVPVKSGGLKAASHSAPGSGSESKV